MARAIAHGDDTALNMTPMIDVCFQLIVFFMLTLKFPTVAHRLETQLPAEGPQPRPDVLRTTQDITVKLFRKDGEHDRSRHFTRVRVGEVATVDLPRGPWPTTGEAADARRLVEDKLFATVAEAIGSAWSAQGRAPEVRGQIRTPPPTGQLVPHGDVMRVLDAFIDAGIAHVHFEGAPLPR
jgi:biopolymer transport protein ExbD